jgi:hypothetical protein
MKRVGEDLGGNARTLSPAPRSPPKSGHTTETTEAVSLGPEDATAARRLRRYQPRNCSRDSRIIGDKYGWRCATCTALWRAAW